TCFYRINRCPPRSTLFPYTTLFRSEPLVGMISGLRVMKGHRVVVEAAARLLAAGVRARFVFVGRGSMEDAIRELVTAAGLTDRRSEEHTSELQSLRHLVCRLLLEKK